MPTTRLDGLIAATYTPLHDSGQLNPDEIPAITRHLLDDGIRGLYVCGSTGEGMSLSTEERRLVAEEYIAAAAGRVPVIVQVGHNSLTDAAHLAAHAQEIGASVVSATCPSYFRITSVQGLIDSMAAVASAAPELPFYYYHIPEFTGSQIDMVEFLQRGSEQIPNLAGLKFTCAELHNFQQCVELDEGRFDVVWGFDEMLLAALATGARAGIGSTYNIAAPLYARIIAAVEQHDLVEARRLQSLSVRMIRILDQYPFHPAMKTVLAMQGMNAGPCRLPLGRLTSDEASTLQSQLEAIGFFEWSCPQNAVAAD